MNARRNMNSGKDYGIIRSGLSAVDSWLRYLIDLDNHVQVLDVFPRVYSVGRDLAFKRNWLRPCKM